MKKTILVVSAFIWFTIAFPSFAQQKVERTLKTSDTCECLSAALQLSNVAPYYNKWMLLDAFDCIDKEWLILTPGPNWLSIPRHIRPDGEETTPTSVVFHKDNISGNLSSIDVVNNNINENMEAGEEKIERARWQNFPPEGWEYDGDERIQNIHSTRGYIVSTSHPSETKLLSLYGDLEDPQTPFDLYCQKENWVGYFLREKQSVFDALSDILGDIYHIQHEDYNCWKINSDYHQACNYKSVKDSPVRKWKCNGARRNIEYGDMIMVTPEHDIFGFQWNYSGNPPDNATTQQAEYYTFEEEIMYSTFVIELDSANENPIEIGAFVNDTCVGASHVEVLDSVIVLSAYLDKRPGDSVVFEKYYGTEKSTGSKIKDYYVSTPFESKKQKRIVKTGERSRVFIVSFSKQTDAKLNIDYGLAFAIYPNPATNILFYSLTLQQNEVVSISISDITGKLMATPVNETMDAGHVNGEMQLRSDNGKELKPGIYLVQLKAGQIIETKKVIVK